MLLSEINPQEHLGKRVRVRLQTDAACEERAHDAAENGWTGTLRRCEARPDVPSHH